MRCTTPFFTFLSHVVHMLLEVEFTSLQIHSSKTNWRTRIHIQTPKLIARKLLVSHPENHISSSLRIHKLSGVFIILWILHTIKPVQVHIRNSVSNVVTWIDDSIKELPPMLSLVEILQ